MNNQGRDLNLQKELIEKVINIKVKASLQPSYKIMEINFRYPNDYKPSAKKDKDKTNWNHQDRDKTKSHNLSSANINQSQTQAQAFKKNKCHQKNC